MKTTALADIGIYKCGICHQSRFSCASLHSVQTQWNYVRGRSIHAQITSIISSTTHFRWFIETWPSTRWLTVDRNTSKLHPSSPNPAWVWTDSPTGPRLSTGLWPFSITGKKHMDPPNKPQVVLTQEAFRILYETSWQCNSRAESVIWVIESNIATQSLIAMTLIKSFTKLSHILISQSTMTQLWSKMTPK